MNPTLAGVTPTGQSHITMAVALLHPWSRGSVHINSTVGTDSPVIDPHYLENSMGPLFYILYGVIPNMFTYMLDMQILVQGLKFAKTIANTEPLKSAIASQLIPAASVVTDDQIITYIKASMTVSLSTF